MLAGFYMSRSLQSEAHPLLDEVVHVFQISKQSVFYRKVSWIPQFSLFHGCENLL